MRSRSMTVRLVLSSLLAALALCAVGAGSALAVETPEWFSSTSKPAPEFQQSATKLKEAVGTKWKGKVTFEDRNEDAAVECEGSGEGTAGLGAADKVTSWSMTACTPPAKALNREGKLVSNVCEKHETDEPKVEIGGLPWRSELTVANRGQHDLFSTEGTKYTGFVITCRVAGLNNKDTCNLPTLSAAVSNGGLGVEENFNELNGEALTCSLGGKGGGHLATTAEVDATKGTTLEANVITAFSKVTSAVKVTGTSELTLEDKGDGVWSPLGITCPEKTEGTVEAGGKGTITNFVASECKPVGKCEKINNVTATTFPWSTELYEAEGAVRDRIAGGNYTFGCTDGGVYTTDTCSLNVSPEITNGLEGDVFARFSEGLTKTTCKYDSKEGQAQWRGELKLVPTSGAIEAKK